MAEPHIEWTTPAPLWPQLANPVDPVARRAFHIPAILRFASDSFMDEFLDQMNQDPARLPQFVAAPETWSAPPGEPERTLPKAGLSLKLEQARNVVVRKLQARSGGLPALPAPAGARPLKLYQPAHQRYYLVSACLVCKDVGLPDRHVNTSVQEKVSFVVRMLYPRANAAAVNPDPAQCDELALIGKAWQVVSNPGTLLPGEEQNALSPVTYAELDGRKRRLWVGLLPTGKREAMVGASRPAPAGDTAFSEPVDERQMQFKIKVLGPWANLEKVGRAANAAINAKSFDPNQLTDPNKTTSTQLAEDQIVSVSWYVFLDFAKFLEQWLPNVWQAIVSGSASGLSAAEQQLWSKLKGVRDTNTSRLLTDALRNAKSAEQTLESVTQPFVKNSPSWPPASQIFPLGTVSANGIATLSSTPKQLRKDLEALVAAALPVLQPAQKLPVRAVAQVSAITRTNPWFTVRCVLERPNCGVLSPPLLSDPSAAFQIAAFFDPDAPARPVRIGLPVDTTPAGLRKFDKNATFVMSDLLCQQVSRMGDASFGDLIRSVLPFPLHADLPGGDGSSCQDDSGLSVGMVCSLSIPIITIVAFLLLIIFVKLFDIVFFWMPFFQICLPVPKFKPKGD